MRKFVIYALALTIAATPAFAGAVANIEEDGTSASGASIYKVTCSNGSEYRIYWADGQWYEGGLGAIGGQHRDLEQQAAKVCE